MLGVFVAMGVGYLVAEALVVLAIAAVLTPVVMAAGVVTGIGIVVLGLVAYAISFGTAYQHRDRRWMLDHFLAPALAAAVALVLFDQIAGIAQQIIDLSNGLSEGGGLVPENESGELGTFFVQVFMSLVGVALAIGLGLAGIAVILGAPFVAVVAMSSENAKARLFSYGAFVVTGSYWGLMVVAVIFNRPLPSG